MRRFAGLCYVNFSPLKSMESQLSLGKINVNVLRPKLIENERNEVLKNFYFSKKNPIFSKFENPMKKTAPRAVFFENFIQLQNTLESLQIIFRTC